MLRKTLKMASESKVSSALEQVLQKMQGAVAKRPQTSPNVHPRLVAVSKTKPINMIIEAYVSGQRHFGENYLNELEEKSKSPEILEFCKDIRWHFIGTFQKNKASKMSQIPNLFMVETVSSIKSAVSLNNGWTRSGSGEPLKIMVQVNTSGENNKSGCSPTDAIGIIQHIQDNCPALHICGLMTIGAFDHDLSKGPNPDFQRLVKCREEVCQALNKNIEDFELSMGMSGDFEHAIEVGSTNVRVGSTIFGARPPLKPKTDDKPESSTASQTTEQSSTENQSNTTEQQNNMSSCNDVGETTEKVFNMSIPK